MNLTPSPARRFEDSDQAEREIEIFYPAGYFYQVVEVSRFPTWEKQFAVKVFSKECNFLGYAP